MTLPHPRRQIYRLGLPHGNLRLELAFQFVRHLLRRLSAREVLDDVRIPNRVEVWPVKDGHPQEYPTYLKARGDRGCGVLNCIL